MSINLRELIRTPGARLSFRRELSCERLSFPAVLSYLEPPVGEGEIRADLICICDRCAAQFESVKTTPLSAVIVDRSEDNADDPELFFLDGNEIDLGEMLATLFILDVETKCLCREDCKGLCPKCGKNLNLGPCGCGKEFDPRFAVLEQLLDTKPGE